MKSVFIVTYNNYVDYEGGDSEVVGVFSQRDGALELVQTELKGKGGQKNFEPDETGQFHLDKTHYSQEYYDITEWAIDGQEKLLAMAMARRLKIEPDPATEKRLMNFVQQKIITLSEIASV